MATRICANRGCGKLFDQQRSNQKYCCEKCNKAEMSRRYREKHRAEINRKKRESYKADQERKAIKRLMRERFVVVPSVEPREEPAKTEPYISYGKHVAQGLLEQQAREMERRKVKFYAALKGRGEPKS